MTRDYTRQNRIAFSVGTIGRDMVYSLVNTYLIFYLTDVRRLPDAAILQITNILLLARLFDACNDPLMGAIVNNTRSRFGRFKPWMALGALLSGLFTVMLFSNLGILSDNYVLYFACLYIAWGLAYTANDISYWSLLPTLSRTQREHDKAGALARICASLGAFSVVALIVPVTNGIAARTGGTRNAYTIFAAITVLIMLVGQAITVLFVRERDDTRKDSPPATLRSMARAIVKNDQLLVIAAAMGLFTIATTTTTSFGLFYFKYIYGDEGMYTVFAIILGVVQVATMALYPAIRKKFKRGEIYAAAVFVLMAGYLLLFFTPARVMPLCVAAVLCASGQALIQLLLLVFLTDTVLFGQWKLGERHESVVFSLQPFLAKLGGAVATWLTGRTVVLAGLSELPVGGATGKSALILKCVMMLLPLVLVVAGHVLYRAKYRIDETFYEQMSREVQRKKEA